MSLMKHKLNLSIVFVCTTLLTLGFIYYWTNTAKIRLAKNICYDEIYKEPYPDWFTDGLDKRQLKIAEREAYLRKYPKALDENSFEYLNRPIVSSDEEWEIKKKNHQIHHFNKCIIIKMKHLTITSY